MAQRPPGAVLLVDASPCCFGSYSQLDEVADNVASPFPVPEHDRASTASDVRIQKLQLLLLCFCADPEEADPSAQVAIDSLNTVFERLSPVSWRHIPDLLVDAILRPLREQHLHVSFQRISPEPESEEVSFLWPCDGALTRIHLQPQSLLDEMRDACPHALAGS